MAYVDYGGAVLLLKVQQHTCQDSDILGLLPGHNCRADVCVLVCLSLHDWIHRKSCTLVCRGRLQLHAGIAVACAGHTAQVLSCIVSHLMHTCLFVERVIRDLMCVAAAVVSVFEPSVCVCDAV